MIYTEFFIPIHWDHLYVLPLLALRFLHPPNLQRRWASRTIRFHITFLEY
jgi:hypothetical protein